MKYVVLVGDGMADEPITELGNRTPLQAADKPNMDYCAERGVNGLARTVPHGMGAGSDVANLSIMGYDPAVRYTGRGPLEAASMNVPLEDDDLAYRCNLITEDGGMIVDYSADHISNEEAAELIRFVDERLGSENVKFHPGISYRHLLVFKHTCEDPTDITCTPPHDVLGKRISEYMPGSAANSRIAEIMRNMINDSKKILETHRVNVDRVNRGLHPGNMIWPWGGGRRPEMSTFKELYNVTGGVISAVDLIKGIGICAGLKVVNVSGATGYLDTNYAGKVDAALNVLEKDDFVFVHIEAPDEAGHSGKLDLKMQAIEDFDRNVAAPMLGALEAKYSEYAVLVMPDHPTPLRIRTHSSDPVPFTIFRTDWRADDVKLFDEVSAKSGSMGVVEAHKLMGMLLG